MHQAMGACFLQETASASCVATFSVYFACFSMQWMLFLPCPRSLTCGHLNNALRVYALWQAERACSAVG